MNSSEIIIEDGGLVSFSRRRRTLVDLLWLESDSETEDDDISSVTSYSWRDDSTSEWGDSVTESRNNSHMEDASPLRQDIRQLEISSMNSSMSIFPQQQQQNVPGLINDVANARLSFGHQATSTPQTPQKYIIPMKKPKGPKTPLELELEVEIMGIENHFKWILELEPQMTHARVNTLKDKMICWLEESTDVHLSCCQKVTQRLQLAVYEAWLENFSPALKYIDDALKSIEEADEDDEEPLENIRMFRHITFANKLIILTKRRITEKDSSDANNNDLAAIQETREKIKAMDVTGGKYDAANCALKGQLANQLGNSDVFVTCFEQAVKLNPKCYDWLHHLYTSLRRKRREHNYMSAPSEDERNACHSACDLKPNSWLSYLAMAQLYEEINKGTQLSYEEHEENANFIVEQLTGAVESNPNSISANIRLAEAYLSLDKKKSEELFLKCLEKWPTNSQVLHKIGKFYKPTDRKKAETYLSTGIKVDSLNFPCLMDWIRLKHEILPNAAEMIEIVSPFLEEYKHKLVYHGKLLVVQGSLYWADGKIKDAANCWTRLFEAANDEELESSGMKDALKKALEGSAKGTPIPQLIKPVAIDKLKTVISQGILNCAPESTKLACLKRFEQFIDSTAFGRFTYNEGFQQRGNRNNANATNNNRQQQQRPRSNYNNNNNHENGGGGSVGSGSDNSAVHKGQSNQSFFQKCLASENNGAGATGRDNFGDQPRRPNVRSQSESDGDGNWRNNSNRQTETRTNNYEDRGARGGHYNNGASFMRSDYQQRHERGDASSQSQSRIEYDENGRWRRNPEYEQEPNRIRYDENGRWRRNPEVEEENSRTRYDENNARRRRNPEQEQEKSRIKYDENGRWRKNPPE